MSNAFKTGNTVGTLPFLFSHVCMCVYVVKFLTKEVSFKLLINQCVSYVSELGTLILLPSFPHSCGISV